MKKKLVLIGGGGHCKSVIDVVEQENIYTIKGVIDSNTTIDNVMGYPILGGDELIPSLVNDETYFLITVGQIKSFSTRLKIANLLIRHKAQLATVISPLAYVSKHARINSGTIIMHKAIINADSEIGQHCIINTLANVEHDAKIENFCHISTCAVINGGSIIKHGTFIGSNATVANNITICENSVIGGGAIVNNSLVKSGTYVGVPAKLLK